VPVIADTIARRLDVPVETVCAPPARVGAAA